MSRHAEIDDELWESFHHVVNMSSRQLQDWLRTLSSGEYSESFPDRATPEIGRRVLRVLQKRRGDLDAADRQVMQTVIDTVRAERGGEPGDAEPEAGSGQWRHRLMSVGHDPLRPMGRHHDGRFADGT